VSVLTGLDRLLSKPLPFPKGTRVGVLCHQASVDRRLLHVIDALQARGARITALFAPEHGLWGTAQDQIPIGTEENSPWRLPVTSLYGDHRAPSPEQLEPMDLMICDLQDVGSRYYTFIWTMALAMQACAKAAKRFIVLDRPNPINGVTLEGPILDLNFASFVGLYALPVRHGLTIGEVARWINDTYQIGAELDVVPMKGWRRTMFFAETGVPWVLPSPNMPTEETAWVYPGGCLLEATNLSEGRGTTRPFELTGAPFIDADALAKRLNGDRLPGVFFRPSRFEPTFHKFKGELCGGVQVHVTDRGRFKPFYTYVRLLQQVRDLYPREFAWRPPPYEYELVKMPIDILCGDSQIRETIEAGGSLRALESRWRADGQAFARQRKPFLLYN
jgi:uncharacterized protein YbbC (DUF1343 family)